MPNIKIYKELTKIELFNGENLYTEASIEELFTQLNNDHKFLKFGERIINKSNIKELYRHNCDGIEGYILSLSKDLQREVRQRDQEKKEKVGKGFISINEISNYLKSKGLI